ATQRLDPAAALQAIQTGLLPDGRTFDPTAMALVEDRPEQEAGTADPDAGVTVAEYTPTRMVLQSHARATTFLVLSEMFFPGGRATVDGAPTPIWRTDYVLRGMALPAGAHRIVLVYDPRSVRIGAAISALTLAALLIAAIVAVVRGRRAHATRAA